MPLFGKSSKSPADVTKHLKESLTVLERGTDAKKELYSNISDQANAENTEG